MTFDNDVPIAQRGRRDRFRNFVNLTKRTTAQAGRIKIEPNLNIDMRLAPLLKIQAPRTNRCRRQGTYNPLRRHETVPLTVHLLLNLRQPSAVHAFEYRQIARCSICFCSGKTTKKSAISSNLLARF